MGEDGRLLEVEALRAMFADEVEIHQEGLLEADQAALLARSDLHLAIKVVAEEAEDGEEGATLHCILPPGYPEHVRPVVSVEVQSAKDKEALKAINSELQTLAQSQLGEPCIFDLYTALREELLPRLRTPAICGSGLGDASAGNAACGEDTRASCPNLPPLPPRSRSLAETKATHRGPTKRSNWVIPGHLMAGDRSGLDEEAGMKGFVAAGITTIVCLQTRQETRVAVDYRKRASQFRPDMLFLEMPIPDQKVIEDEMIQILIDELVERIARDEVLYVHCRGGHGRTGTVCALLLGALYGLDATESLARCQFFHDARVQPVFYAESYDGINGDGCILYCEPQREQVVRMLGTQPGAVSSEALPDRASSDEYGPGASAYDEATMRWWREAGMEADAAMKQAMKLKGGDGSERRTALLAASEAYRKTKDLRPDDARGHVGLIRALRLAGEIEEAMVALAETSSRWPDMPAVQEEMKRLPAPETHEAEPADEAAAPALAAPTWRPRVSSPRFVMLVGLPGSGKSTFSAQLVKTSPEWVHICQDNAGGRSAVENEVGAAGKNKKKRILFDRCNELKADRKIFMELAFGPADAVCVHFDMAASDCEARVAARTDHPTIKFGMGRGAVRSKQKSFQVPTEAEGFVEVITVRDFRDVNHLLTCWGAEKPSVSPQGFFKFPTTPHVIDLGATLTESDRLLTAGEAAQFFDGQTMVTVEEKVDGANCGISLSAEYEVRFQNRAKYVTSAYASQWKGLDAWKEEHASEICTLLEPEVEILFGEWCLARHSMPYTHLPAYFVAFDIYNKREGRFCSAAERDRRLSGLNIPVVPHVTQRAFNSVDELTQLMQQKSNYYNGPMEGIYLRVDEPPERGNLWLLRRGKIVQPGFLQVIEEDGHWIHKDLVKNGVSY